MFERLYHGRIVNCKATIYKPFCVGQGDVPKKIRNSRRDAEAQRDGGVLGAGLLKAVLGFEFWILGWEEEGR